MARDVITQVTWSDGRYDYWEACGPGADDFIVLDDYPPDHRP